MKNSIKVLLLCSTLLLLLPSIGLAQEDDACPTLVMNALTSTADLCSDTGRNQACYGNLTLIAEAQEGVTDLTFENPGDIANVADLRRLSLSDMDTGVPEWGVALMKLQANLPDTLPGQNVMVLLFGNVALTNAVDPEPPTLAMTATAGVNVRLRPVDGEVMRSLSYGEEVTATGRLADSSWIQIAVPDDTRGFGWVSANFLSSDDDVMALAVMEPGAPVFAPMQAFYFHSGVGDASCSEAPDSGILIQTPGGSRRVELVVNEVTIELGSTVYLYAASGAEIVINNVEGSAYVTAVGQSQYVPAGTRTRVPLDEHDAAIAGPSAPEPYDIGALPAHILTEPIEVSAPLTEQQIEDALSTGPSTPILVGNPTIPVYGDCIFDCDALPLFQVANGTAATILEGPVNPCGNQLWYKVQAADGTVGWVMVQNIQFP